MNRPALSAHCRDCLPMVLATAATLFGIVVFAYSLRYFGETSFEVLFRDIASARGMPVYQGLFSQVGLIVWSIAIGILLLVNFLPGEPGSSRTGKFFKYSLAMTLVLALDDAFLLHESVFEEVFGLNEKVTFGIYGLLIVNYLYVFRTTVLNSQALLLLLALTFFGVSIVIDMVPQVALIVGSDQLFLLEDGSKLAGILFWTIYQFTTARNFMTVGATGFA